MANRKYSVWAWIVGTLFGVPVFYGLSFGPACWLSADGGYADVPHFYWPVGYVAKWSNGGSLEHAMIWYATLGVRIVDLPCTADGNTHIVRDRDHLDKY